MRRRVALCSAVAAVVGCGAPAQGAVGGALPTALGAPLGDEELSEQRGGFVWSGLDIRFGAEIRSFLGNALVVQTNVSWTDAASEVERTVAATLTPAAAADLRTGMLAGSGLNMSVGGQSIFIANGGQTAFIQRTDGTVQNIIVNTASNVELRQQVDAELDIAHFAPFQQSILTTRIGSALAAMSSVASVRGMQD